MTNKIQDEDENFIEDDEEILTEEEAQQLKDKLKYYGYI